MISLVINTCANGPKAAETLSSGKQPHAQRSFALRNFILPAAIADPTFDEIIVVGEWEPGNGYIYIEVPSEWFSCVDALAQRQAGFERSTGDWIVFQHDDHLLDNHIGDSGLTGLERTIGVGMNPNLGVLVPARHTRLRNVNGEKLFSGEAKYGTDSIEDCEGQSWPVPLARGYISGHCAIYRREVLEACPWGDVDKVFSWDVQHTAQIREAGFSINWSDALRCYDIEAGARPWG